MLQKASAAARPRRDKRRRTQATKAGYKSAGERAALNAVTEAIKAELALSEAELAAAALKEHKAVRPEPLAPPPDKVAPSQLDPKQLGAKSKGLGAMKLYGRLPCASLPQPELKLALSYASCPVLPSLLRLTDCVQSPCPALSPATD